MGKVFHPDELQAGHWPEPQAHIKATDDFFNHLGELNDMCEVSGVTDERHNPHIQGMAYGSTVRGEANVRSDNDVLLVVGERQYPEILVHIADLISSVQGKYHTPFEISAHSMREIMSGNFFMNPCFAESLRAIDSSDSPHKIGNISRHFHSLSDIKTPGERLEVLKSAAVTFFEAKRQQLFRYMGKSALAPADLSPLQHAFEAPPIIGRDLIRLQVLGRQALEGSLDTSIAVEAGSYTKKYIYDEALKLAPDVPQWQESLEYLRKMDTEYSQLLDDTIAGETSLDEYTKWVTDKRSDALEQALLLSNMASEIATRVGETTEH